MKSFTIIGIGILAEKFESLQFLKKFRILKRMFLKVRKNRSYRFFVGEHFCVNVSEFWRF